MKTLLQLLALLGTSATGLYLGFYLYLSGNIVYGIGMTASLLLPLVLIDLTTREIR